MITQTFDRGWGPEFPLKAFEQQLITDFLQQQINDNSRTVVINSVWYTREYHLEVIQQLRDLEFDRIVLVAMLDAAIPQTDWYSKFDRAVHAVGYYPGAHNLDFWALFVDQFFNHYKVSELADHTHMVYPYMCLNRKPHRHRVKLFDQLTELGLIDQGLVSMGGHNHAVRSLAVDCEHDNLAPNPTRAQTGLPNDIASVGNLQNWQQSFLNIVTETVYNINQHHFVSEKIFKPIVGLRPFLVYDTDGAVTWLQSRGFESYVKDFGDISDLDLALPENIAPFLQTLCEQPVAYFQSKFVALLPKMLYNRTQFTAHVAAQKYRINQGLQCQI
jgi:hypothetical protein